MTEFTSSTGVVRDVELDLDAICAYEESHPGWSLPGLAEQMQAHVRFSDYNLLAKLLGFAGLDDVIAQGFSLEDMADMVLGSKYWGFMGSEPAEDADSVN